MAAGAQNLLLALAVPLISPFELQHQIFREHPAPEQLFLIATPQHCCPCLYINIYSEPRTEHQSSALPPPPARPGRASPAASPSTAAAAPAGPESGCAETDLGPTVLLLLHRLGWTRPCPVPRALCPPPAPRLPAGPCEEREARSTALRSPDAPVPTPGAPPSAPLPRRRSPPRARTAPARRCLGTDVSGERGLSLWRCSTMVWRRQRVGGGCAGSGAGEQQGRESRSPGLGWLRVLAVPLA